MAAIDSAKRNSLPDDRPMRKPYVIALLILFVVANGLIIFWVWNRFADAPDPEPETKEETRRQVSEEFGRTEGLAYDLIAKWNREQAIPLDLLCRKPLEAAKELGCCER
jgi:flagellar basal body-associated protein FliL